MDIKYIPKKYLYKYIKTIKKTYYRRLLEIQMQENHIVNITQTDFRKLTDKYNGSCLSDIVRLEPGRAKIYLRDIPKEENVQLKDELYQMAYCRNLQAYSSYFMQLKGILELPKSEVQNILEVGCGRGFFKALIGCYDYGIKTLDYLGCFQPSIRGDMLQLPIKTEAFDVVCSFQALQHLPFECFKPTIKEFVRCTNKYVFISLPCKQNSFYLNIRINIIQKFFQMFSCSYETLLCLPTVKKDVNKKQLPYRHFWEVNTISYSKHKVLEALKDCGLKNIETWHNLQYPYHFFILGKK